MFSGLLLEIATLLEMNTRFETGCPWLLECLLDRLIVTSVLRKARISENSWTPARRDWANGTKGWLLAITKCYYGHYGLAIVRGWVIA
jgi:hypothetical protein